MSKDLYCILPVRRSKKSHGIFEYTAVNTTIVPIITVPQLLRNHIETLGEMIYHISPLSGPLFVTISINERSWEWDNDCYWIISCHVLSAMSYPGGGVRCLNDRHLINQSLYFIFGNFVGLNSTTHLIQLIVCFSLPNAYGTPLWDRLYAGYKMIVERL